MEFQKIYFFTNLSNGEKILMSDATVYKKASEETRSHYAILIWLVDQ